MAIQSGEIKAITLYLMDMSNAENTSGVDRYLNVLINELKRIPYISIYRIVFLHNNKQLFHKQEACDGYTKITIPMPQQANEIIAEVFWFEKFSRYVYQLIKPVFEGKENRIIHLHTLNLIYLATYIRRHVSCKIVTHVHCIPWKELYNTNPAKFNRLYRQVYEEKDALPAQQDFMTHFCELLSYEEADAVVCVTHCAKDFLTNVLKVKQSHISVIPNGMYDCVKASAVRKTKVKNDVFQCLYVGIVTHSKGLSYIIDAMHRLQREGYNLSLVVAGRCSDALKDIFIRENRDLKITFLGRVSFEELRKYYEDADMGIIASLQEQSSYVAIEMAMFGLPVITTAVDGLDEMFRDGVNALKVNTKFSLVKGLSVDVDTLATRMKVLIENTTIREKLRRNVRKLYCEQLTAEIMINRTVSFYKQLINLKI